MLRIGDYFSITKNIYLLPLIPEGFRVSLVPVLHILFRPIEPTDISKEAQALTISLTKQRLSFVVALAKVLSWFFRILQRSIQALNAQSPIVRLLEQIQTFLGLPSLVWMGLLTISDFLHHLRIHLLYPASNSLDDSRDLTRW